MHGIPLSAHHPRGSSSSRRRGTGSTWGTSSSNPLLAHWESCRWMASSAPCPKPHLEHARLGRRGSRRHGGRWGGSNGRRSNSGSWCRSHGRGLRGASGCGGGRVGGELLWEGEGGRVSQARGGGRGRVEGGGGQLQNGEQLLIHQRTGCRGRDRQEHTERGVLYSYAPTRYYSTLTLLVRRSRRPPESADVH